MGVDGLISKLITGQCIPAPDIRRQGSLAMSLQKRQRCLGAICIALGSNDPGSRLILAFQHEMEAFSDNHMLARDRPAPGRRQNFPDVFRRLAQE